MHTLEFKSWFLPNGLQASWDAQRVQETSDGLIYVSANLSVWDTRDARVVFWDTVEDRQSDPVSVR